MSWRSYSQTLLIKIKVVCISGSTMLQNVTKFAFIACPSTGLPKNSKTKVQKQVFCLK